MSTRVDDLGTCSACGAVVRRDQWSAHWSERHPTRDFTPDFPEERDRQRAAPKELPKAARYTCADCGLTAPAPIVRPAANPKDTTHGRCSNRRACDLRVLRALNKHREEAKHG